MSDRPYYKVASTPKWRTDAVEKTYNHAFWYACGVNDHRDQTSRLYVDPDQFASYAQTQAKAYFVTQKSSHLPSIQDQFRAFYTELLGERFDLQWVDTETLDDKGMPRVLTCDEVEQWGLTDSRGI